MAYRGSEPRISWKGVIQIESGDRVETKNFEHYHEAWEEIAKRIKEIQLTTNCSDDEMFRYTEKGIVERIELPHFNKRYYRAVLGDDKYSIGMN